MTEHAFQADVARVLGLVIDSLYSDKDIFLRELVSNAADALDKLRFRAVTEEGLLGSDARLAIRIRPDAKAETLTLEDNGIGMSEAELVEHLGTVARSGTRQFLENLEGGSKKDVSLIGQFGVGFYSAYLVADRVDVTSRPAGSSEAHRWSSDGKSAFTVEPAAREGRGTTLTLHLKPDHRHLLEPQTLRALVKRFSDFVRYPVELVTEKDGAEHVEQLNKGSAPWQEPPATLDDDAHAELYQHLTGDWEGPLARSHFRIEGNVELVGLLYLPKRAPFDLFDPREKRGVKLFVRRVQIFDSTDLLLPPYLRFMRGLVDSDDLPLNVSRELLQDSAAVRTIHKQLTKRSLDLLDDLARDKPEDFATFTDAFGAVLKEGLATDASHRERLATLARFHTTHEGSKWTSLDEYVARMKDGQEAIYYATADSADRLAAAPQLEALRARGYEVLLGTDTVDELALEQLGEHAGKPLVSALRAEVAMPDDTTDSEKEAAHGELAPLLDAAKSILGERVADVVPSSRLTDSPACLVLGKATMPAHLEKLFRQSGRALPKGQRILELNPRHALVKKLAEKAKADAQDGELRSWLELLCDQAALAEGSELPDPARFAQRVSELLTRVATA